MPIQVRERPLCRKQIISRGLRPHLGESGKWDGYQAIDPNGNLVLMSDGMKTQMRLMIPEGYWDAEYPLLGGPDYTSHPGKHEELNGVRVRPMPTDEIVLQERRIHILVIRPKSSIGQRKQAGKVAAVANRELQVAFGIYHASDQDLVENHKHVLLACDGSRAVALLLLRTWKMRDPQTDIVRDQWTVFCVWVAKNHRRRGIGTMLINAAAAMVGLPVSDLVFQGPFSDAGAALMRAVAPDAKILER